MKTLSREWSSIPTAKFAPDEEIEVGGKKMTCVVIKADYEIPEDVKHPDAGFRNVKTNFTFWIDKESGLIRRSIQRADGVLKDRPGIRFSSSTERSYEIAELNNSDFSLSTFKFTPPVSAILVKEFESNEAQALAKLIGKPMGSLILRPAADKGEPVTLQAFAGQPVLLDFWATWCQPCRDSLPALERLYADYQAKGLVVVSLDEDEDAPRAIEFWTANKVPWSNFHASKEILDNFPTHGIPYFVLLDSSGKVTFSSAGLDESSLRNAIAVQVGSASR